MIAHVARPYPHAGLLVLTVFCGAVALEIVAFAATGKRYAWREAAASIVVAVIQRVATAASALVLVPLFAFVWDHRIATVPLPVAWQFVVAFPLVEFAYYAMHRGSHRIACMWATHSVHHSAEQLNLPAAVRLGATGLISFEWLPFVPLVALGLAPQVVAISLAFNLLYQFFLHSELIPKLGPFEWVFNTPSHHRVHHARNAAYLDRNFGGVLIVYDRLFGTFAEERADDPPIYGLLDERRGGNPLRILFAGWSGTFRATTSLFSPTRSERRARPPLESRRRSYRADVSELRSASRRQGRS